MSYCNNCGYLNDDSSKFCMKCGTPLEAVDFSQAQPCENEIEDAINEAEVEMDIEETQPCEPEKPVHKVKSIVFGAIGFKCSLEAFLLCLFPIYNIIAFFESILGIIFCCVSTKAMPFKLSKVGKVFGWLAFAFSIITCIVYTVMLGFFVYDLAEEAEFRNFINELVRIFESYIH